MNEAVVAVLEKLDLLALEDLRERYEARNDRAGVANVRAAIDRKGPVQTEELSNCGRLFAHRVQLDPSGLGVRPAIAFTGDPAAWMSPFMREGRTGRFDSSMCTGENSQSAKDIRARTVVSVLQPGERVQVVKV